MENRKYTDPIILFCAFRYCLGRKTGVVSHCVDTILNDWKNIDQLTKVQFCREITEHENRWGNLGQECDKQQWYRLINKYIEEYGDGDF